MRKFQGQNDVERWGKWGMQRIQGKEERQRIRKTKKDERKKERKKERGKGREKERGKGREKVKRESEEKGKERVTKIIRSDRQIDREGERKG